MPNSSKKGPREFITSYHCGCSNGPLVWGKIPETCPLHGRQIAIQYDVKKYIKPPVKDPNRSDKTDRHVHVHAPAYFKLKEMAQAGSISIPALIDKITNVYYSKFQTAKAQINENDKQS